MAKLELPSDKEIASQLIQSEHQGRLLEIGWIGRIIGTKEQAPFNIAGAKGLIALVAFVWLLVFPSPTSSSDIASRTLPPIVLAVLGYIFGKGGRGFRSIGFAPTPLPQPLRKRRDPGDICCAARVRFWRTFRTS